MYGTKALEHDKRTNAFTPLHLDTTYSLSPLDTTVIDYFVGDLSVSFSNLLNLMAEVAQHRTSTVHWTCCM